MKLLKQLLSAQVCSHWDLPNIFKLSLPWLNNKSILSLIPNSSLILRNVFAIFKDGIQYAEITSGTPIDKQVLFNKQTGTLTFGIAFEQGEVGTIIYY